MNGDRSKQRYVSTFKLQLQPSRPPCAQKNGTRTTDIGTPGKCSEPALLSPIVDSSKHLHRPVFIKPLEDCCVDEGSDLVLRGVLTGSQPIKVTWLHNGERVRFGNSSLNGHDVSFVVRECLPEDAGAYTCLVENGAGRTSCSAAVFVKGKRDQHIFIVVKKKKLTSSPCVIGCQATCIPIPSSSDIHQNKTFPCPVLSFQNPPQHLEVKVGQTANLTCFFTGSPPVVSCWIRNKEQIVDGPELWTVHTERSSTLVIAEATAQHTGRYTVVVKDRKSSAQHTLTLSVIDRPEPPASGPVASLISPSKLVLSWSGPCYDGGSAVLGYVLELRDQGLSEAGKWKKLTAKCASTSYQVSSGLQPGQEYCFRVRAYNAVGESDPSPVSAVVKMEESGTISESCNYNNSKKTQEEAIQYSCVTIDSSHKVTDHYNLHEKLGTGKFGLVFKLTHKETGHVCAGKFYKGRRAKEREAARKEIELMNHLHHPKLVQCLGAYDHKPEMVMVMEFIAGGELFDRIVDDSFEYTEPGSVRCIQQILEGIAFMHQQKIVHLDLKPENIVCVDTTGTCIKIVDFGLACKLDGNTALKVMHGTAEFVAPEVISYEPVCLATDMWSIGVICYILLSGESPFQGNSDAETLALVTAAQWEFDEESFQDITEEAQHFISSLLNKDPRRRMSCEEGLAHPWMKKFDSENLSSTKCLSKEKMKRFLARQKWKKAGKAMLALKRMALLSKNESSASLPSTDLPLSPEAEDALESLERKMQGPPQFTKKPEDQKVAQGSCARLSCHLSAGYPDPEVVWLCGDEPVEESSTVQIEYDDDGHCTLILSKVKAEDANVYTCRATNDHGEIFCTAKLTVL
uniref:Myosin, light chain kinase 5 n=1 Tax=Poecilia formosa TaxID=48698 RepID=A0A087Y6J8_POEFO